jgi:chromosome segregation ATPase
MWQRTGLALASLLIFTVPALAQSAALTVPQIRVCICQEQKIASLRAVTASKDAAYRDRNNQVKDLTTQINQMTATMNSTDTLAQDQLSELIDLRARVQQQVRENALPALQQATNALNREVQSYNASCANRTIYDTDDVEAHKNLSCPVQ